MVVASPTVYQVTSNNTINIQQIVTFFVPVVYDVNTLMVFINTIGILSSQG